MLLMTCMQFIKSQSRFGFNTCVWKKKNPLFCGFLYTLTHRQSNLLIDITCQHQQHQDATDKDHRCQIKTLRNEINQTENQCDRQKYSRYKYPIHTTWPWVNNKKEWIFFIHSFNLKPIQLKIKRYKSNKIHLIFKPVQVLPILLAASWTWQYLAYLQQSHCRHIHHCWG